MFDLSTTILANGRGAAVGGIALQFYVKGFCNILRASNESARLIPFCVSIY
jgi:hypothetical protein